MNPNKYCVNWGLLLKTLKANGNKYSDIAREIKVNQNTLKNWRHQGTEPKYSAGARLIEFAKDKLEKNILKRCGVE